MANCVGSTGGEKFERRRSHQCGGMQVSPERPPSMFVRLEDIGSQAVLDEGRPTPFNSSTVKQRGPIETYQGFSSPAAAPCGVFCCHVFAPPPPAQRFSAQGQDGPDDQPRVVQVHLPGQRRSALHVQRVLVEPLRVSLRWQAARPWTKPH